MIIKIDMARVLALRREVFEFGLLPLYPLLPRLDGPAALQVRTGRASLASGQIKAHAYLPCTRRPFHWTHIFKLGLETGWVGNINSSSCLKR